MSNSPGRPPEETVKAATAFADYIALGPTRSLEKLAAEYVKSGRYSTFAAARRQVTTWSSQHRWQARLLEAITAQIERNLEEAAELDAESFLETSRILNQHIKADGQITPDTVIRVRESVRRPQPKGATNVNVKLDLQISQLIDQVAQADGLTDIERRELEADVQSYLAGKPS